MTNSSNLKRLTIISNLKFLIKTISSNLFLFLFGYKEFDKDNLFKFAVKTLSFDSLKAKQFECVMTRIRVRPQTVQIFIRSIKKISSNLLPKKSSNSSIPVIKSLIKTICSNLLYRLFRFFESQTVRI